MRRILALARDALDWILWTSIGVLALILCSAAILALGAPYLLTSAITGANTAELVIGIALLATILVAVAVGITSRPTR